MDQLAQLPYLPPAEQETILNGPALLAPDNEVSHLQNPPNENDLGIALTVICLVISTLVLYIRIHTKLFFERTLRIEDWLAVASFGIFLSYVYLMFRFIRVGFLVHQWNISVTNLMEVYYILHLGSNIYLALFNCLKASILLEWNRLFVPRGTRNWFWWTSHFLLFVHISLFVSVVVVLNLLCTPYEKIWDLTVPGGFCMERANLDITATSVQLLTDLFTFALPQNIIWSLQMSTRKKLGVSFVFAVGVLGCVAAAARLAIIIDKRDSQDASFSIAAISLATLVESACGFLIICAPAIPRFVTELKRILRSKKRAGWPTRRLQSSKGGSGSHELHSSSKSNIASSPYRMLDEYDVPLTVLAMASGPTSESTDSLRYLSKEPSTGILRTTQIVTQEEYVGPAALCHQYKQQHPWVDKGRY